MSKATFWSWFIAVIGIAGIVGWLGFINGEPLWVGITTGGFVGMLCFIAEVGYRLNELRRQKKP